MKCDIECSFDPDIIWLGEINRQVLRLEREASALPPDRTHLHCLLRQGGDRPAGVFLTLRAADEKFLSFAEDRSPVGATRRAFDKLRGALAGRVALRQGEGAGLTGVLKRQESSGQSTRPAPAWMPTQGAAGVSRWAGAPPAS